MENPAGFEFRTELLNEARLHQPAFVMAFLGPGVREEQHRQIERGIGNAAAQHLDGIGAVDLQIGELCFLGKREQLAHAGAVYLDADEARLQLAAGELCEALPHPEADLERESRAIGEEGGQIEESGLRVEAALLPERIEGQSLRRRETPFAPHEAADPAFRLLSVHGATLPPAQSTSRSGIACRQRA